MARSGDYGTVQPTKVSASSKDLEVNLLVPLQNSELAKEAKAPSAAV